jgi:hypothetical protein
MYTADWMNSELLLSNEESSHASTSSPSSTPSSSSSPPPPPLFYEMNSYSQYNCNQLFSTAVKHGLLF